jgi:CheY-like chemotaxis protein
MSTLLIVDDDAETVRFMEELLAAPGRRIVTALAPTAPWRSSASLRRRGHLGHSSNAERTGVDLLRAIRAAATRHAWC